MVINSLSIMNFLSCFCFCFWVVCLKGFRSFKCTCGLLYYWDHSYSSMVLLRTLYNLAIKCNLGFMGFMDYISFCLVLEVFYFLWFYWAICPFYIPMIPCMGFLSIRGGRHFLSSSSSLVFLYHFPSSWFLRSWLTSYL